MSLVLRNLAVRLDLIGDDHAFDNQLFVTETERRQQELLYLGNDVADDNRGLFYYLRQAALDTRTRQVAITRLSDASRLSTAIPDLVPLVVVNRELTNESMTALQGYASRGGRVLTVVDERMIRDSTSLNQFLSALLGTPDLVTSNYEGDSYVMLSQIDFQHPLFAPFADPRFNDFTKIQFWSHRVIRDVPVDDGTDDTQLRVLASFEDDSPALIEKTIGKGTIWVMTSGWQPAESKLALSTKFIPLLHGFFGESSTRIDRLADYEVGEPIPLSTFDATTTIQTPSGETIALDSNAATFADSNEPGIYQIQQGAKRYKVAVNLAAAESQTERLLPDRLEQLGLRLGKQRSVEDLESEQRQMRNKELEGKQKLWRWGIVAALLFVGLETLVSSRSAVRVSPA